MSATKYGLIGHPLGHSMSAYIHERIMESAGISGTYELFDLEPKEFPRMLPLLMRDLKGFNVTIPYKIDIIPYLGRIDPGAVDCGAVNTVFANTGYNTDRDGFLAAGIPLENKKVLILGAGGVAHMMANEAVRRNASVRISARNLDKAQIFAGELRRAGAKDVTVIPEEDVRLQSDADVVLNGTPTGMWPFMGEMPCHPGIFHAGQDVFDTIYNPAATRWVLNARKNGAKAGGGMTMLFRQAVAAQKIWNPAAHFDEARLEAILPGLSREMLRHFPVKYVFTGFMGAGKTTAARETAKLLKIPFMDSDDEIVKARGLSIPEIFERDGEEGFRRIEADVIAGLLSAKGSAVIALGGGAILQENVRESIRSNGALTVYLHAPLECIWSRLETSSDRPLLGRPAESADSRFSKAARLFELRLPVYEKECDIKIDAEKDPAAVVQDVLAALGYGG